jgi:hypothetical protein
MRFELIIGHLIVETIIVDTLSEVTENDSFRVIGREESVEVIFGEVLSDEISDLSLEEVLLFNRNETISVDSFGFVDPKLDELFRVLELVRLS